MPLRRSSKKKRQRVEEYFDIKEGNRKFVVRFDDIRS